METTRHGCRFPGCSAILPRGVTFCRQHEYLTFKRTPEQDRARRSYYGPTWAKESKLFLRYHPACSRCGQPARHAHHVREIDTYHGDYAAGNDWNNLEPLCYSCHSSETARRHGFKRKEPEGDRRSIEEIKRSYGVG